MNFIEAVKTCVVKKYACFSGRARRSEYWYFYLATMLLSWAISILGLGDITAAAQQLVATGDELAYMQAIFSSPTFIFNSLLGLALMLPMLGASTRRLHDIGKSGWWLVGFFVLCMIPLVNFIAIIAFIFFMAKDSEPGDNQYGPNPKNVNEKWEVVE